MNTGLMALCFLCLGISLFGIMQGDYLFVAFIILPIACSFADSFDGEPLKQFKNSASVKSFLPAASLTVIITYGVLFLGSIVVAMATPFISPSNNAAMSFLPLLAVLYGWIPALTLGLLVGTARLIFLRYAK